VYAMGYSMSLHLKKDAPADELEAILKDSKFLSNNESIYVSQVPAEHGYAIHYDKGLYISFSGLNLVESCFVHSFFKMVALRYGEPILNPQNKQYHPFYNYDQEITLLIPEVEYLTNPSEYKDFDADNGVVVDDDYVEDAYLELERRSDEARSKNEVYNDDITINIHHFTFDYIRSEPYKRESTLPNILANLVTYENKLFKEIFETMKKIEDNFKNSNNS
jgi:hypothetical protein